ADYWKSQGRKFCDFCKCWIADNKPSIDFHEGGKKHKENVSKRLKEIHKNSAKQAKQNRKIEDDIKRMENAAMAAYLKDVENNTKDMTAERIIKEKLNRIETKDVGTRYHLHSLVFPLVKAFDNYNEHCNTFQFSHEVDPCDPTVARHTASQQSKSQQRGDNKNQGKNKVGKGKGKGKRIAEDERPAKPVRKLWYEALSPEGYTYYWHIETNESVWEPPEEGYMTFAEQEEEAKEQVLQEELLKQLDEEEAIANANILEEKRANAEREKLKELRKTRGEPPPRVETDEDTIKTETVTEEESRPYRRDYSIPVKSHPYGPWQTVRKIEVKPVDFQLPEQTQVQLPVFEKAEPPSVQRTFKEKTITQIHAADSDDDGQPIKFKKRKFSNKNVRQRLTVD
ncbi:hypothetical protein E2986_09560, partial [Frieseomelitta varia]